MCWRLANRNLIDPSAVKHQKLDEAPGGRQTLQREPRVAFLELVEAVGARCDGDGAGADRLAAADVVRRVADHEHRVGGNGRPGVPGGDLERPACDPWTVVAVDAERPAGEVRGQAVVLQLGPRPGRRVPGQEQRDRVLAVIERVQDLAHAGQRPALPQSKTVGQVALVRAQEIGGELRRGLLTARVNGQDRDLVIGEPGGVEAREVRGRPAHLTCGLLEREDARPLGREQRAVDVPEEKAGAHAREGRVALIRCAIEAASSPWAASTASFSPQSGTDSTPRRTTGVAAPAWAIARRIASPWPPSV